MSSPFYPLTTDGPRAEAVLNLIQRGQLKGNEAKKAMQEARYQDQQEAAKKGGKP